MKKQILVVDDNSAIRSAFCKILLEEAYLVVEASDGIEAMETLTRERVDLMILDLQMPRMDGWEVLLQLCSPKPPCPIVAVTGLADQLDTKFIPGLGGLLEKPIEAEILLDAVKSALAGTGCVGAGSPRLPERPWAGSAGYLGLADLTLI